jgi:hypothetical protein
MEMKYNECACHGLTCVNHISLQWQWMYHWTGPPDQVPGDWDANQNINLCLAICNDINKAACKLYKWKGRVQT